MCVGFIINFMCTCKQKRKSKSNDLIMSCLQTIENNHAESVASLTITTLRWKWLQDHMSVLSCWSWVVPEVQCMCVYFYITMCTTVKPGVDPRSHITTNRKLGINSLQNNNMAYPKFMPTDSQSSLYGGSFLSTCACYEERAAVTLILSTVQRWPCCQL